jgi:uncharacterized protein HemY
MSSVETQVANGWAALKVAKWQAAKQAFEAALQVQDTPAAHDGLGIALWWLNELSTSHEQRAAAYSA